MKRVYISVNYWFAILCFFLCVGCTTSNNERPSTQTLLTDEVEEVEEDPEEEDDTGSMAERVQRALDKGNYQKAYSIVDKYINNFFEEDEARTLNEKILKQEIASLIDKDENGSSAPLIIYAITERAKNNPEPGRFLGSETLEIKKMLQHTILIVEANENTALAKKLNQSLKKMEK